MICTVRIIRTYIIIAIAVSKNVVGGKLTNFIFCRRLLGGERGGASGGGGILFSIIGDPSCGLSVTSGRVGRIVLFFFYCRLVRC